MVKLITSENEFFDILRSNSNTYKLIVIDFFTVWCPPCQLLAPEFEKMAIEFANDTIMIKVDCDELPDLATKEGISKLPTIKGFINQTNVFTIPGIPADAVRDTIGNYILTVGLKNLIATGPSTKTFNYLSKIVNNVINKPNEEKYRQLKFSNVSVQENLLNVNGVKQCLEELGFRNEENRLYIPKSEVPVEIFTKYKNQLPALIVMIKLNETIKRTESATQISRSNNNVVTSNNEFNPTISTSSSLSLSSLSSLPVQLNTESTVTIPSKRSNIQLSEYERKFINVIENCREKSKLYENQDLMNIVRAIVDIDSYKKNNLSSETILKRLLRWFKYEFFTWFKPPNCSVCSKSYELISQDIPTSEEAKWLAQRVEVYSCRNCALLGATSWNNNDSYRFPRYNHPEMLLSTRTGRCGEWANCFSLILRTFVDEGLFEAARYVMDWTDHVWCEVFIKLDEADEASWIHVDPCEGVYNAPLMYKVGWNKTISYVIGVTLKTLDIQDITWRYTDDFESCLPKRTLIREQCLIEQLLKYHKESKTKPLDTIKELISFLPSFKNSSKQLSEAEMRGRTTGSVEWRQARGELGKQVTKEVKKNLPLWKRRQSGTKIEPTENEIKNGCCHIQYNCSVDKYTRPYDCVVSNESKNASSPCGRRPRSGGVRNVASELMRLNEETEDGENSSGNVNERNKNDLLSHDTDGWKELAYSWCNVKRKVEYDWQVVYIARTDGCPSSADGFVSWLIDVSHTNKVIGEVSIFATSAEFQNSLVKWFISTPNQTDNRLIVNGFINTDQFKNSDQIILSALLSSKKEPNYSFINNDYNDDDGDDDEEEGNKLSWQHTQLCRQKSTDFNVKTLQIKIELIDKVIQ